VLYKQINIAVLQAAEDRMVWLYEDMKDLPEYKKWLY
jgi:hypothetical protein